MATQELTSLTSVSVTRNPVIGGQSATGRVTLSGSAPASGVTVALISSNPAVVTVPQSDLVPLLHIGATFPVTTQPVTTSTPVTILLEYLQGGHVRDL